jgi:CRISPR-associated protein Cas6
MNLDLSFSLIGADTIAADHGYVLYGAISRLLPHVHADNGVGIHPIRGRQIGNRQLMLMPWSRLTLRVNDSQIASMLPLAGKALRLGNTNVRIGVPSTHALNPASSLRSRLVVIKVANIRPDSVTPEQFTDAVRRQIVELGISKEPNVTLGKRRTLRLKQREIVGYEVFVEGLAEEESLTLQDNGLGGKRHMGCGVFVPAGKENWM